MKACRILLFVKIIIIIINVLAALLLMLVKYTNWRVTYVICLVFRTFLLDLRLLEPLNLPTFQRYVSGNRNDASSMGKYFKFKILDS